MKGELVDNKMCEQKESTFVSLPSTRRIEITIKLIGEDSIFSMSLNYSGLRHEETIG